jgi:predicted nucleotidyltransferase
MVSNKLIAKINTDFEKFKKDIFAILLFGSYSITEQTRYSDIDICLVAGGFDTKNLFSKILESGLTNKYDIKIFERLPLKIKGMILEHHIVVWTRDREDLSYYFYKFRKIWEDQKLSLKKLGMKIFK